MNMAWVGEKLGDWSMEEKEEECKLGQRVDAALMRALHTVGKGCRI